MRFTARWNPLKRDGKPIGTYARHYYDLFKLSDQEAVIAMLKAEEYAAIKEDYDKISREYFPNSYFYPEDMEFANSDALFPPRELSAALEGDYEKQCRQLCYGPYPSWTALLPIRQLAGVALETVAPESTTRSNICRLLASSRRSRRRRERIRLNTNDVE